MIEDPKNIVRVGYDICATAYAEVRSQDPSPELELLTPRLSGTSRILDIGCGSGVPVTRSLSSIGSVVGVDISASQIQLARQNVPQANFIHGDIMDQQFEAQSFDAVVAFYALFHLPRGEHTELLKRISTWLRAEGYLLATLPRSGHPGYTEPDFFGATMYWSHFETAWYLEWLSQSGFVILHNAVVGNGYRAVVGLPPERHPVVLAQKVNDHSLRSWRLIGRSVVRMEGSMSKRVERWRPKSFREVGRSPSHFRAGGRGVVCSQCEGDQFIIGQALLNTTLATFFGLDWTNRAAYVLTCYSCGRIEWFAEKPEEI